MSLRARLAILMVLLTLLPALPALYVGRQLVVRSLDLGLSTELDAALEAGLRHSAQLFRERRDALKRELDGWQLSDATLSGSVDELLASRGTPWSVDDRLELLLPDGTVVSVQQAQLPEAAQAGDAPALLSVERALSQGRRLRVTRAVDPVWRADAQRLQSALQLSRLAQNERAQIERSFWIPFAIIYVLAVAIALAAALWMGRGLTRPVSRLLDATREVARGHWDVQVEQGGPSEIAELAVDFNSMVRTLDAQHRSLSELEKMAGWREMARTLAHEVKNPLTPIQLTVEEMQQRYRGDDGEYRELLAECTRIVIEEVESLRNVVQRFREFSRPVELKPVAIDLGQLLGDIAALQRDLRVTTDLAADLPPLHGDPDRLRQLFMNLAENARNVGAESLRIVAAFEADGFELRFEDDGPGIPVEERERVFEPYRSGRHGGLGLGLALAKGIVLAHGGSIRADESSLGGAALIIQLPLRVETT